MKTIFTLSILALSICAFGQNVVNHGETTTVPGGAVITSSGTANAINKDKTPAKALTAADSIVLPVAKFEPSVKVELDNFDAEIAKLSKQYEDLMKAKNQTLKTFYIIYCDQKKIDPSRATVKLGKDGFIIQVLK